MALPERDPWTSEATYATKTKYLVRSGEIHETVRATRLSQESKNELFLMKYCMDNGLGRDQGQQLMNWMKKVCYIDIVQYLTQYYPIFCNIFTWIRIYSHIFTYIHKFYTY